MDPVGLLPLLAIGAGSLLLFGLLNDDDDDDRDRPEPEPEPEPSPDGMTEGDDVLTGSGWIGDEERTLFTLGGDDLVDVERLVGNVYLGDGNDTLTAGSGNDAMGNPAAVRGEDGNDSIVVHGAYTSLSGGDGDDWLTFNETDVGAARDPATFLSGGDGNDTIEANSLAGADPDRLDVYGGAGQDSFILRLAPTDTSGLDPEEGDRGIAATLQDFTAGEDTLAIDPISMAGDATYNSYSIQDDAETGRSYVTFYYDHPDRPEGMSLSVEIANGPIDPNDIQIIIPPDEGVTNGDDSLTAYDWSTDTDGTLQTRDGNDIVAFDDIAGPVDLGAGNDTFIGIGSEHNDFSSRVKVDGGSGNDSLSMSEGSVNLSGGDGDDTLIGEGVGSEFMVNLEGGPGADTYKYTLTPGPDSVIDPGTGYASFAGEIFEFETGIDKLIIDPVSMAGDATYSHYVLYYHPGDGQQHMNIHFTHPDHPDGLVIDIIFSFGSLTPDDIEIVGATGSDSADNPEARAA